MDAPTGRAVPATGRGATGPYAAPAAGQATRIEVSRRARRVLGDRPLTADVRVTLGCMARIEARVQPGVPEAVQEYQLFDVQGLPVHLRAEFRTKNGTSHVRLLPRRLVVDAGRDGQLSAQAHYS